MIRIAVPNKGILAQTAAQMLAEAGYHGRNDTKDLIVADPANDAEFFYLRPRDIATYVGGGALDVGITGRDLLLDSGSSAIELDALGFGRSQFRFAGPADAFQEPADLNGTRVATSYPGLVGRYLTDHGVTVRLVTLDGAVESAVRLGVADAVADVVQTGATLRKQGLRIFGPVILDSEAVLIGNGHRPEGLATLKRRLDGVIVARRFVLIEYDLPADLLEQAVALTPGSESPTVSPLRDAGWVAVRAMVSREKTNDVMDDLYDLGARAILVTPIHAARM
ncbi:MAG TPA: ATP phosphoribosyltransferase [Microbacteriaceae bacterium]|nr:ATP phosphoribosyltransferase [Microbacteriaceae bacterium]